MTQPEYEPQPGPVVRVARDLRECERLAQRLGEEAVNASSDPLMPGGRAMVLLAPIANYEAWSNLNEATERANDVVTPEDLADPDAPLKPNGYRKAYTSAEDEDPDEAWSAFQLLAFWSEDWRRQHGQEFEPSRNRPRPTILTEANFLRWLLLWAWENLPEWDDFAKDVATARTRLETIVHDGERSERGAPCMYDECGGVRLVRKMVRARDENGAKTWRQTDWHCPRCKRSWDEDAYARNVTAAHERTKAEDINGDLWVSDDYAARRVGRSVKTIRTWVNRGKLATVCLIAGRRIKYVRLADVEERHEEAKGRAA